MDKLPHIKAANWTGDDLIANRIAINELISRQDRLEQAVRYCGAAIDGMASGYSKKEVKTMEQEINQILGEDDDFNKPLSEA